MGWRLRARIPVHGDEPMHSAAGRRTGFKGAKTDGWRTLHGATLADRSLSVVAILTTVTTDISKCRPSSQPPYLNLSKEFRAGLRLLFSSWRNSGVN